MIDTTVEMRNALNDLTDRRQKIGADLERVRADLKDKRRKLGELVLRGKDPGEKLSGEIRKLEEREFILAEALKAGDQVIGGVQEKAVEAERLAGLVRVQEIIDGQRFTAIELIQGLDELLSKAQAILEARNEAASLISRYKLNGRAPANHFSVDVELAGLVDREVRRILGTLEFRHSMHSGDEGLLEAAGLADRRWS